MYWAIVSPELQEVVDEGKEAFNVMYDQRESYVDCAERRAFVCNRTFTFSMADEVGLLLFCIFVFWGELSNCVVPGGHGSILVEGGLPRWGLVLH